MNKNIPHAVKVVREALASSGSDPAAAVVHALNDVRLLVDPERSFGAVLRRAPGGAWQTEPRTELEAQAAAWDEAKQRAVALAERIPQKFTQMPGFQQARAEGDHVTVGVSCSTVEQWHQLRIYFGITEDRIDPLPYALIGRGHRDGVAVSVVAYDVPQLGVDTGNSARRPYRHDGVLHDLAFPQRDITGQVWFFQGEMTAEGVPLLVVDGRPERCSLTNIVEFAGPLTPVTATATPVTEGGEAA
ncbi:BN159_2729 family protein [Streptomyces sp. NPDC052225]|uniref:BN159_2729 family protein n=1 Tax=Streptomyces sp. NPDC052225 TaxID=3154949 RepID=UPI0034323352